MKRNLIFVLSFIILISLLYFIYRAEVLISIIKAQNIVIKQKLDNSNASWVQFDWLNLEQDLSNIEHNWKKVLILIPSVKKELLFQDNLRKIISFNKDFKTGILVKSILNNDQNYLAQIDQLRNLSEDFHKNNIKIIDDFFSDLNKWCDFLGFDRARNYLILFQSPSIQRPNGGLITAYAILTVNKGITAFKFDNILSLDDLILNKIIPPEPLKSVNTRWLIHDVNWFFDFSDSARKTMSWYQQTNYSPILDGVISVNTNIIQDLINSLKLNDKNTFLNTNNINELFIKGLTDSMHYTKSETDGKILNGIINAFVTSVKEQPKEKISLIQNQIKNNIIEKEIQLYSNNDQLEYYFDDLGITGKILASQNDYLAVVFSNLSPTFKSNKTTKMLNLTTDFSTSTVINTLIISETKGAENLESYIKIYLPNNAIILNAEGTYLKSALSKINYSKLGYIADRDVVEMEQNKIIDNNNKIEIYKEGDKTVIGTWAKPSIAPIKLIYRLPDNPQLLKKWQIIIQKQSGNLEKINYNIILPAGKKIKPNLFEFNKPFLLQEDFNLEYEFE